MRDALAPVLRESKFREHGRITPDEFVAAGDFLTYKFPTWQWCAGDPSRARDYLPRDKQYLVTRGVPCFRRVSKVHKRRHPLSSRSSTTSLSRLEKHSKKQGGAVEDSEQVVGDEWIVTHADTHRDGAGEPPVADIPDSEEPAVAPVAGPPPGELASRLAHVSMASSSGASSPASNSARQSLPSIPDADEFGLSEHEDAAQYRPGGSASAGGDGSADGTTSVRSDKIMAVRTYDCLITYDKYYQTPRMWLVGYDEDGVPLQPSQIFEDVAADHVQKTVTIEPFPHGSAAPGVAATGGGSPHVASIHPCKHASMIHKMIGHMGRSAAEVDAVGEPVPPPSGRSKLAGGMRRVFGRRGSDGDSVPEEDAVRVDQYLVIFLKFMASIVPTIEMDATQAV